MVSEEVLPNARGGGGGITGFLSSDSVRTRDLSLQGHPAESWLRG